VEQVQLEATLLQTLHTIILVLVVQEQQIVLLVLLLLMLVVVVVQEYLVLLPVQVVQVAVAQVVVQEWSQEAQQTLVAVVAVPLVDKRVAQVVKVLL
jgi:hypothetical protein